MIRNFLKMDLPINLFSIRIRRIIILSLFIFMPILNYAQQFTLVKTLIGHSSSVMLSVFSPDGSKIFSGDFEGNILVWDASTGMVIKTFTGHHSAINSLSFDRRGQFLISAGEDGNVIIWNIATGEKYLSLNVPFGKNSFAIFSPNEKFVYFGGTNFGSGNHSIYKLELSAPVPKLVFQNKYYVTSGIISSDSSQLIFSSGYTIKFLNLANDSIEYEGEACGGYINSLAVYGKHGLASWCEDGSLNLWNEYGNHLYAFTAGQRGFSRLSFSHDGKWLIAGTGDSGFTAKIWDVQKNILVAELKGHNGFVKSAYFSPDDKTIVTSSYDGTIKLWQVIADKKPELTFSKVDIPAKLGDRKVHKQSEVKIASTHLELFVWDRELADGDSISLNINGKWVLEKYELVKDKLMIAIDLIPDSNNYLILYAHNLGRKPPNTAAVSFFDGKKEKILTLKSDLKNCGAINFVYKKNKQRD